MRQEKLRIPLEIKAASGGSIEGHGSVFGNVDLGGDIVMPGAFSKSLAEHANNDTLPQMFWMHDPAQVAGKWTEMREDDRGLVVKGEFADTQLGREMRTLTQMKAVRGLSIGYRATDVDFDRDGNRLLKGVDLWEVSIVSMAMNPLAEVTNVKSRLSATGEYVPTLSDVEHILRDAGMSRSVAKHMVSKMYDGLDPDVMSESLCDAGVPEDSEEAAAAKALAEMFSHGALVAHSARISRSIRK